MPNPLLAIGSVAEAIKEGFKLVSNIISGHELRKLRYRVESAISFVQVVYEEGDYKDITPDRKKKLMVHFRKRIFDE